MDLKNIKLEYIREELDIKDLAPTPLEQVKKWFEEAIKAEISYPNAASLATISKDNIPSNRIVLIKEINENGVQFFTDYTSSKGQDLDTNPIASILLFWKELDRQIRITGKVSKTSREVSQAYFAKRPKESQISATASMQSKSIDKEKLQSEVKNLQDEFKNKDVECPSRWGGFHIELNEVEIWQGRPNRLHDRFLYKFIDNDWKIDRLSP
jgi:pyridoxamine 5'-phosphate oxidase